MSWIAIAVADFVAEGFNADERSALQTAAGGDDGLQAILNSAVAQWRGVIEAGGGALDADTTKVPPSCKPWIIAQVRWQVLLKFPELQKYQTDQRQKASEDARDILAKIAAGDWPTEDPAATTSDNSGGNWNADEKIQMRTQNNRANS